jgi:glycerol-3-phosphate dehydrogenase
MRQNAEEKARQRHISNCVRSQQLLSREKLRNEETAKALKREDEEFLKREQVELKRIELHVAVRQKFMRESRDVAIKRTQIELPGAHDIATKTLQSLARRGKDFSDDQGQARQPACLQPAEIDP